MRSGIDEDANDDGLARVADGRPRLWVEGCAATRAAHQALDPRAEAEALRPVAPGQRFGGADLEVLAPRSEGWVVKESSAALLFDRPGTPHVESYMATVSRFEAPDTPELDRPEAFTAYMRRMIEGDPPDRRSEKLENRCVYSVERGYACVRCAATGIDTKAPGGALPQAMYALYCRHPHESGRRRSSPACVRVPESR